MPRFQDESGADRWIDPARRRRKPTPAEVRLRRDLAMYVLRYRDRQPVADLARSFRLHESTVRVALKAAGRYFAGHADPYAD